MFSTKYEQKAATIYSRNNLLEVDEDDEDFTNLDINESGDNSQHHHHHHVQQALNGHEAAYGGYQQQRQYDTTGQQLVHAYYASNEELLGTGGFKPVVNAQQNFRNTTGALVRKPYRRNSHCVKEKVRRDRIRLSCTQLKRLVPAVNGLKTDMASFLETTVAWAQLIEENVPEEYLNIIRSKLSDLSQTGAFETIADSEYNMLSPSTDPADIPSTPTFNSKLKGTSPGFSASSTPTSIYSSSTSANLSSPSMHYVESNPSSQLSMQHSFHQAATTQHQSSQAKSQYSTWMPNGHHLQQQQSQRNYQQLSQSQSNISPVSVHVHTPTLAYSSPSTSSVTSSTANASSVNDMKLPPLLYKASSFSIGQHGNANNDDNNFTNGIYKQQMVDAASSLPLQFAAKNMFNQYVPLQHESNGAVDLSTGQYFNRRFYSKDHQSLSYPGHMNMKNDFESS